MEASISRDVGLSGAGPSAGSDIGVGGGPTRIAGSGVLKRFGIGTKLRPDSADLIEAVKPWAGL